MLRYLKSLGIEFNKDGKVKVDGNFMTTILGVLALEA
jgi:hypothetical protein